MENASALAEALGRKKMMDALGVGATAISNAVVRGWFPTNWYMVCKKIADDAGIDCPPELFQFREAKAS